jgi:hypothetical protein
MALNKLALSSSAPLTITLNGRTSGQSQASAFVDNATNLYVDAHVSVKVTLAATGTVGDQGVVNVYAYGSEDGTTYGPSGGPSAKEAIDGSDKTITMNTNPSPSTLWGVRIGVVHVQLGAAGTAYVSPPFGVAQAFGGFLPRRWGLVVENRSGIAFAGTGCSASYTGISSTTI